MTCLGALSLLVFFNPFLWAYEAWVAVKMWSWFVAPIGVPQITIPQAFGINLLLALWRGPQMWTRREEYKEWYAIVIALLAQPSYVLAFGWAAHRFLG